MYCKLINLKNKEYVEFNAIQISHNFLNGISINADKNLRLSNFLNNEDNFTKLVFISEWKQEQIVLLETVNIQKIPEYKSFSEGIFIVKEVLVSLKEFYEIQLKVLYDTKIPEKAIEIIPIREEFKDLEGVIEITGGINDTAKGVVTG